LITFKYFLTLEWKKTLEIDLFEIKNDKLLSIWQATVIITLNDIFQSKYLFHMLMLIATKRKIVNKYYSILVRFDFYSIIKSYLQMLSTSKMQKSE
jgi:hypothetical protein